MIRQKPMRVFLSMLLFCLGRGVVCYPQDKPQGGSESPLAVVAGQPIYEQDLMSVAGPGLLDLHKQEYKLKSDALDKVIRKKLIEVEAEKRGISTEELLKQEIDF